jgi:hypothetical protein
MILPDGTKDLTALSLNLIEDCRVSRGQRESAYRQYYQWLETGRAAGGLALANMLYGHVDRLASHLLSPSGLRFTMDYENVYAKEWQEKGRVVARMVTREWERKNIDMLAGHGVKEALTYGACLLKQLGGVSSDGTFDFRGARLVMPHQFGVYDESVNDLGEQECFVETVPLNRHQVWRRVRNLPNAEKLFKRITAGSSSENNWAPSSFMHQVLSTAVLNTSLQNMTQPQPGGIVQLSNDPNFATLGPQVAPELYPMHELWVRDDSRDGGEDYTTIQIIEPDILVAPLFKRVNLFCKETNPYQLLQPNFVANYFWGRSEVVDLLMLQEWLTTHLDDVRRLMGIQIDKILGFEGVDQITDELYGQLTRQPGMVSTPAGTTIKDLTPAMPETAIPMIGEILMLMDRASGFSNILSGQGEAGVRAGDHADLLQRNASPRLRDRALLVERQIASAADATLAVFEAKNAQAVWTEPDKEESEFLVSQLPEDRRISVDAHSSSPIFAEDHQQLLAWGVKAGIVTKRMAIEEMPFEHKDLLIEDLKEQEAAQKQFIEQHPEVLQRGHGGKRAGIH